MTDCTRAGLDGMVEAGTLGLDGCCPPDLCNLNDVGLICNFIQALPSGPLWDQPKAEALAGGYVEGEKPDDWCPTMVDHAVYTARRLIDGIRNGLWPAIREADAFTAHTTLDNWLKRYGWRDCYDCACREQVGPTPIEVVTGGTITCALPSYPDDLQLAVKRGIVIALERLSYGPRRNLAAINWVIDQLGARVDFECYRNIALDPTICDHDDGLTVCLGDEEPDYCPPSPLDPYYCTDVDDCPGHDTLGKRCGPRMRQFQYCIRPAGDLMPKAHLFACDTPSRIILTDPYNTTFCMPVKCDVVKAYYEPSTENGDPDGLPPRIYPGVMAAECIVRAMMPRGAKIKLQLCI